MVTCLVTETVNTDGGYLQRRMLTWTWRFGVGDIKQSNVEKLNHCSALHLKMDSLSDRLACNEVGTHLDLGHPWSQVRSRLHGRIASTSGELGRY